LTNVGREIFYVKVLRSNGRDLHQNFISRFQERCEPATLARRGLHVTSRRIRLSNFQARLVIAFTSALPPGFAIKADMFDVAEVPIADKASFILALPRASQHRWRG
jgi:hypothetical protein